MTKVSNLTWPDYGVLALAIALLFVIGYRTGKEEEDTQDFFLGRRRIPGWAACLSFVATEISAVTLISVPATAYMENWQYAQFFVGSALARLAIAYLFIPAFYNFNCVTIYEFLKHRFGPETQLAGSIFFLITRLLGSGVRLMAASLAVAVLLGWPIIPAILLFTLVSILYIAYGGIKAVVWTNVFQAATFIAGGVATLAFLHFHAPGGLPALLHIAHAAGKMQIINWGPGPGAPDFLRKTLFDPNIIWLATLNGFFGSMAAFGTDHDLMQRLLTVETRKESQKMMALTPLGSGLVLAIYLCVGAGLYGFYASHPGLALPQKWDALYPHFANTVMPAVLRGLVLSAIVMASIDSPLASLSASFVTDIYRPLIYKRFRHPHPYPPHHYVVGGEGPPMNNFPMTWAGPVRGGRGRVRGSAPDDEKHFLLVSRIAVVAFGLVLAALAYGFSFFDKILWLAFKIGGVTFGSLLGVFLLGLLTQRPSNRANIVAMVFWAAINLALLILSEKKIFPLGWSWLVILGTFGTMGMAWLLSPLLDKKAQAR